MTKTTLATFFDSNYVARAIVEFNSLRNIYKDFVLYMYCFDDISYEVIKTLNLECVVAVAHTEFETEELLKIKSQKRKFYEYYWACKPYIVKKTLEDSKAPWVIYIDADFRFFSDPSKICKAPDGIDVLIQTNNFSAQEVNQFIPVGYYCSCWEGFRNNASGLSVLDWWHNRCMEWCYSRFEDGKFGDQKYLDDWRTRFKNVREITNVGANIAPWNLGKYDLSLIDNKILINDEWVLIYYHYHGFRMNLMDLSYIITGDRHNNYPIPENVVELIYKPYVKDMKEVLVEIKKIKSYRKYVEMNPEGVYLLQEQNNNDK